MQEKPELKMTLGLIITILALGIALFLMLNQYKKTKTKLNSEISTKIEENKKLNSDLERFSEIISIENEIESKNKEFSEIQENSIELNDKFVIAKSIFKELEKDIK